jgi:hypothetical protein
MRAPGGADRTESYGPGQVRLEDPLDHRADRSAPVCRHLRCQRPRQSDSAPLVQGIPPIRSRHGRRRAGPASFTATRGTTTTTCGDAHATDASHPGAPERGWTDSSPRLGRHRWTIERTRAWLARCQRLHRRYAHKPATSWRSPASPAPSSAIADSPSESTCHSCRCGRGGAALRGRRRRRNGLWRRLSGCGKRGGLTVGGFGGFQAGDVVGVALPHPEPAAGRIPGTPRFRSPSSAAVNFCPHRWRTGRRASRIFVTKRAACRPYEEMGVEQKLVPCHSSQRAA